MAQVSDTRSRSREAKESFHFWTPFMAVQYARGCGFEIGVPKNDKFVASREDIGSYELVKGKLPGGDVKYFWRRTSNLTSQAIGGGFL